MAYRKFDDPAGSAGVRYVDAAFANDAMRRALQGISNVVLGSTSGTASHILLASCGTGTTAGAQIGATVVVRINGAQSTCIAQDNLEFPNYGTIGTAASSQVMKFLISTGSGTSGTMTGPGNIVTLSSYDSTQDAIDACHLPDLPDGHCALGYFSLVTPVTTAVVIGTGRKTGTTGGTATWHDLVNMPYSG